MEPELLVTMIPAVLTVVVALIAFFTFFLYLRSKTRLIPSVSRSRSKPRGQNHGR